MPVTAPLRVVELLAARLCHDLISPVAAIANGAELLGEDDPDFVREAVALVSSSARDANTRLQFFRFAYGFGGGGLAGPAPHLLAAEYFAGSSHGATTARRRVRCRSRSRSSPARCCWWQVKRCRAAAGWSSASEPADP